MQEFKYYWEDFPLGNKIELGSYSVHEKDIIDFGKKFDPQYFHIDPKKAKGSPYGSLIACGWHTCGIIMRLMNNKFLAKTASMGSPGVSKINWHLPVRAGDKITGNWVVTDTRESSSKPELGIVKARVTGLNQNLDVIITIEPTMLIFKK